MTSSRDRRATVDERVGGELLVEAEQALLQLGRRDVPRVPAVAVAGDPAQRAVAVAADEDRRARRLHRVGQADGAGEVDVAAVERGDLIGPQRAQCGEVLVGPAAPLGERDAEGGELLGQPADADPQLEAATAEVVERVHLARPQQRMAQRHEGDRRADAQRRRVPAPAPGTSATGRTAPGGCWPPAAGWAAPSRARAGTGRRSRTPRRTRCAREPRSSGTRAPRRPGRSRGRTPARTSATRRTPGRARSRIPHRTDRTPRGFSPDPGRRCDQDPDQDERAPAR